MWVWRWRALTRELGHGCKGLLLWHKASSGSSTVPITPFSWRSGKGKWWGAGEQPEAALQQGWEMEPGPGEGGPASTQLCGHGQWAAGTTSALGLERQPGLNFLLKVRPLSQLLTCFSPWLQSSVSLPHTPAAAACLFPASLSSRFQTKGEMAAPSFSVNHLSTKSPPTTQNDSDFP